MERLDKQKLIKYIDNIIKFYGEDMVLELIKDAIQSGRFDLKEEEGKPYD